jgi:predicted acyltransferase
MTSSSTSQRLLSLDAFRGATIAGMMLVNNPGQWDAVYPQLRHAAWNGWTFTDFIFPFFLWIVGVAMTMSFAKRVAQGADRAHLMIHVVRRAAIIFALGLFLSAVPFGLILDHHFSWATLRIPGVLQRIGICYLIASSIVLYSGVRAQVWWIVGLLASYWLLIKLIPVPGFGAGFLEPTGNLAWYIDSNLLAGHTWSGAPVPGFDPEGILSTLPAIATTLFGVLTGHWLRTEHSKEEKTAWMFVVGVLMLFLGTILDMWLPINKNLWTSSYSIFMAGWALVCLAVFYWFIDVKGHTRWAKIFVIYGMNAIAVYVMAGLIGKFMYLIKWTQADGTAITVKGYIYQTFFVPFASPINASLAYAIGFVLLLYLIAWVLWKKRWFIKV